MANVVCSCIHCASELGCFRNSWIGIGNSYFSPVYPPLNKINGLQPTGAVFSKGPDGSAVQNSILQDLACTNCGQVVGLRVDDTPAGQIMKKNQLILRLAQMRVLSEHTGEEAEVSVQQKIPLVAPGTKKAARRAATLQPMPRQETPNTFFRDAGARSVSGTMRPPARYEDASHMSGTIRPPAQDALGKNLDKFSAWAEDAIKSQQKDIDRINGAVTRIERDMESFKSFMVEMRAELEANRATRQTQQESNQEQLAWLQEDLKELRQENRDFQQDLREEELPDIRNQLDQIRQEIDSHEQAPQLPNNISLPISVNEFKSKMLDIRREFSKVDGLRVELQQLQKRLTDMDVRRRDSSIFPRALMSPNQSSQAGSRVTIMPTIAGQRPQIMLQSPKASDAHPSTNQHDSSPRKPPGAFPNPIANLGATSRNVISQAATPAVSTRAQSHIPAVGPEIAEKTSSRPSSSQKWSYTGPRRWQSVKNAFEAFGLKYPKLGVPHGVGILEDHVNISSLQNTAPAIQYGEVISVGENDEDVEDRSPSELNDLASSLLKRKHDQIEGGPPNSNIVDSRKKRKQSFRATEEEEQSTNRDKVLSSPSLNSSERGRSVIISSARGSPELGRDSRFRSIHGEVVLSDPADGFQISEQRPDGAYNKEGGPYSVQPNLSNKQKQARASHRREVSEDELASLPPLMAKETPASRIRDFVSKSGANAVLKSIEDEETAIPGAFPSDNVDTNAAAPDTEPVGAQSKVVTFDPRTDSTQHFKCGICGNKYRNPTAMKYHKTHSSCNHDPRDETPTKFRCPYCSTELRWGGLAWHLKNVDCRVSNTKNSTSNTHTPTVDKGRKRKDLVAVNKNNEQAQGMDNELKRKDVMAARERLVRETLEREI